MQFLYPIGLFALASLVVPIVIHLWRINQGKTLKIGSITLLGESAASNSKSLQISEWLLFLLRCLLFILLAFVLATPFWASQVDFKNTKGWILIAKQELKSVYVSKQKTIDSLLKKGFEIHNFGKGFEKIELKDTSSSSNYSKSISSYNHTSLLKEVNSKLPNRYPVWVFAEKKTNHFDESMPTLHIDVEWRNVQLAKYQPLRYTQYLDKTYEVKDAVYATTYQLKTSNKQPVLNVLVSATNLEDSKYVESAIAAIGAYVGREIHFQNPNQMEAGQTDIIFWLSPKPVDKAVFNSLKADGRLLKYGQGKEDSLPSFIASNNSQPIQLYKTLVPKSPKGETWWSNAFGQPLLTKTEENSPLIFTYYGQFNQLWTDWVWQANFANAIMPIIYGNKPESFGFESINNEQLIENEPISIFKNTDAKISASTTAASLNNWLWLLAALVLGIERFLTYKQNKLSKV